MLSMQLKKPQMRLFFAIFKCFLEQITELNKKFQERNSRISNINDDVIDFYSTIMNLILKTEHKKMIFKEKLKLVNKFDNQIFIKESFCKSIEDFYTYITDIYGGAIDFN